MDVNAAALTIFILFSLFVPASMILTSILLRKRTRRNTVRDAPYESAEQTIGSGMSIMREYLNYFTMFIAYEILVAMLFVWVPVARSIPFRSNVAMLSLLAIGMVLEVFVMLIARKRD